MVFIHGFVCLKYYALTHHPLIQMHALVVVSIEKVKLC